MYLKLKISGSKHALLAELFYLFPLLVKSLGHTLHLKLFIL